VKFVRLSTIALAWLALGVPLCAAEKPASPSVLTKMSNTTKRAVNNTKNALTPKKTVAKNTGATKTYKPKAVKEEKPGFFKSLFNPEPPPPPKTIKEWMSLKQIHP